MTKIPVSVALRGLYNAGMEWNGGCESCGSMEIVSDWISPSGKSIAPSVVTEKSFICM